MEEQLSHFREMDEDQEDVATLTNGVLSAFRNRVRFECWFLTLMRAQKRPDQTQHETPVKAHPGLSTAAEKQGRQRLRHPSQAIGQEVSAPNNAER